MPKKPKKTDWSNVDKILREKVGEEYEGNIEKLADETYKQAQTHAKKIRKEIDREIKERRIKLKGGIEESERRSQKLETRAKELSRLQQSLERDVDRSLESSYERTKPGLLRRMFDYLTGTHPKSKKRHHYIWLFLGFFILISLIKSPTITGLIFTNKNLSLNSFNFLIPFCILILIGIWIYNKYN